jgi:hypothetical protein
MHKIAKAHQCSHQLAGRKMVSPRKHQLNLETSVDTNQFTNVANRLHQPFPSPNAATSLVMHVTSHGSTSYETAQPSLLGNFPAAINGMEYCILNSTKYAAGNVSILNGWNTIAILKDSNLSKISCIGRGANALLRIYPYGYVPTLV